MHDDEVESEEDYHARIYREKYAAPPPWRRVYADGKDITDTVPPELWPWPWRADGRSSRTRAKRPG